MVITCIVHAHYMPRHGREGINFNITHRKTLWSQSSSLCIIARFSPQAHFRIYVNGEQNIRCMSRSIHFCVWKWKEIHKELMWIEKSSFGAFLAAEELFKFREARKPWYYRPPTNPCVHTTSRRPKLLAQRFSLRICHKPQILLKIVLRPLAAPSMQC
jgi:hypothetical protein